tara:strand:+ start:13 stop:570 length:558 start_codon:yes stop_codon:yes gene_type:complete
MTSNIDIYEKFVPLISDMLYDYKYNVLSHFTHAGKRIEHIMEESFPENIHELVSGKCFITVSFITIHGFEKEIISEFTSKRDLIDCITASSFVPIWTDNKLFKYRNKYCIDSNILFYFPFLYNKNTVSITFDSSSDIHPTKKDLDILHTFIPVEQNDIIRIINCGIADGEIFLSKPNCIWKRYCK